MGQYAQNNPLCFIPGFVRIDHFEGKERADEDAGRPQHSGDVLEVLVDGALRGSSFVAPPSSVGGARHQPA